MQKKAKIKNIEDDAKVIGIGDLFKRSSHKLWSINIELSSQKNHVHFSCAPILARKRHLNPTQNHSVVGKTMTIDILDAQKWEVKRLSACKAYHVSSKGNDGDQWGFVAKSGNTDYFIPHLELARVLFYHDSFMARLSLQHNALEEDFSIGKENGETTIHVLEHAEYPLKFFEKPENRRFLSWVILDQEARASFDSIAASLISNQSSRGDYDFWRFRFSPPSLHGVRMTVRGWHDFKSRTFFVWEITALEGLPSSVSGEVHMTHPKFVQSIGGNRPVLSDGGSALPEELEIDDEEMSDADKQIIELDSMKTSITYAKPFSVKRIATNERHSVAVIGKGEHEYASKDISVNGKDVSASLPGGAWNNLNDETDDAHLYIGKFKSFDSMLELLANQHGCQIVQKRIRKLPQHGNGKKHLLTDTYNARCIAVVELYLNNNHLTLLEIDTSDGAASLSTMLLKTSSPGWIFDYIEEIERRVMKKSLSWPTNYFKRQLGQDSYHAVPHPRSDNPGQLSSEEIAPWAKRFVNWMNK